MDRREFLKQAIFLGMGVAVGPGALRLARAEGGKSRVVVAVGKGKLEQEAVGLLLDRGIEALFRAKPRDVWPELVGPGDVVGLKVNCLAGRGMSTREKLVRALAHRLTSAGVKLRNIVVWDRANRDLRKAGYRISRGVNEIQCYGTDEVGYYPALIQHRSIGSLFSRVLVERCTKVINLPVLKDHGICGVTLGLKNFFGAIHNPNKYHDNVGDPFIADLNAVPFIRGKNVLTVVDGLVAQYEGGPPYMPQWTWPFGALLLSVDPVALDYVGWQIIERKRAEKGLPSLEEAGRKPQYILTAADPEHHLGTADPDLIEVLYV
ncbi:MAG TPA: DUF362 domain-containing protein [Candidatus Latescibacteria bacterium]|nr:DUF362 domain-containing protein [Candidatus Latescibacterota bacterium]